MLSFVPIRGGVSVPFQVKESAGQWARPRRGICGALPTVGGKAGRKGGSACLRSRGLHGRREAHPGGWSPPVKSCLPGGPADLVLGMGTAENRG